MTFASRLATATGISLVLTLLLMLIFHEPDTTSSATETLEASGGVPVMSEPGIRPISLR